MTDPKLNPLGIVWMIWSGVCVLGGLLVALVAMGVGGLVSMAPDGGTGEPTWLVGLFFGGFGAFIGLVLIALGGFGVVVGQAVRQGRRWALIAALVLALFQLTNMPFGTALAIWTFVVVIPALSEQR